MYGFARVCRSLGAVGVIALGSVSAQMVTACGGGGGGGIEGEYVMQMGESPGEAMSLELMSDGKAVLTIPGVPPVQGAHSMEGDNLVVILGGDRDVYTVGADGNLTTTEMGETMVFVKQ
jgi:hypothetical protein